MLVVDDNDEHRYLLVKTLLRKFPTAQTHECSDEEKAIALVKSRRLVAVVLHRSLGLSGLDLTRQIRRIDPSIPIVLVSGIDRSSEALQAGASAFLHYDEWLRIGTVVAELTAEKENPAAPSGSGSF